MDVNAKDKEFTDLHVNFTAGEFDAAGAGDGAWDGLRSAYSVV
jgi:hypothetical protein